MEKKYRYAHSNLVVDLDENKAKRLNRVIRIIMLENFNTRLIKEYLKHGINIKDAFEFIDFCRFVADHENEIIVPDSNDVVVSMLEEVL